MNKKLLVVIIGLLVIVFIILLALVLQKNNNVISESNNKSCATDSDCVIQGEDGGCNCGCYNIDYNWKSDGDCFCLAPTSCQCVNGTCQENF